MKDGEDITGVFQTLGVNLPDLTDEATEALEKAAQAEYKVITNPDDHSALVWYTRNIVYRFVANQSKNERQLADELEVTAGRTNQERVLVVTLRKQGATSSLLTSIDLAQSASELHRGTEEATHAFNMMSGLFASQLEGEILPGQHASFADLWMEAPDDAMVFISVKDKRKEDLVYMEEHGFPKLLVQRAKDSNKVLFIPNKPTNVRGESRWAWLEMDPTTFETIAVMDTGEHVGFAEYLMAFRRQIERHVVE